MNAPTAFRATYSDLKLIKTRQCVQIVFELPLADFDAAYLILGGLPNPANETWFGIAPLNVHQPAKEVVPNSAKLRHDNAKLQPDKDKHSAGAKRDWHDLQPQQQAGIRCSDPIFSAFLKETYPNDWQEAHSAADCVRLICGVVSRSELETNQKARVIWHQLDESYQAWKALEHA